MIPSFPKPSSSFRLSPLRQYAPIALMGLTGLLVAVTVILPLAGDGWPRHSPWIWVGLSLTYLSLVALGVYLFGLIRDMDTAQRDTTADLNKLFNANEYLSTILRSIDDGVITTRVDGGISMMNAVAEKLTGWPQSRALGQPLESVFRVLNETSRQSMLASFRQLLQAGKKTPAGLSSILMAGDGKEYPIEWSITPLLNAENEVQGSVIVFRDATEQRHAQRQRDDLIRQLLETNDKLRVEFVKSEESRRAALNLMQDAQRAQHALEESEEKLCDAIYRLRESNVSLEEYAHVASHDLQEPLRKIESFIQVFREDCGDRLTEQGARYLEIVETAAARMRKMIKDVLEFAEAGASERPFAAVDLDRVVTQARDNLSEPFREKNAELVCQALPVVTGDESQLLRVFQNLMSNALKFNKQQTPRVEIRVEDAGSQWKILLSDNGIGMPAAEMTKLFSPFKRLHGRDQYAGTGIGLAVCRKIVARHGGSIGVDSVPGKGSTFWLMIPKREAQSNGTKRNATSRRRPDAPARGEIKEMRTPI